VFVPFVQLLPPSVMYCQVAPVSSPMMLTVPFVVMLSVADVPVSWARARLGAAGGVWSTLMARLVSLPVLPARSVCLTLTVG